MVFIPIFQGHTWLKDDEASHCKQCKKEFSISRRKVMLFSRLFLNNVWKTKAVLFHTLLGKTEPVQFRILLA